MSDWRDEVRREYEELKERFRDTSFKNFQSGDWFFILIRLVLENYSKTVDAEYICKHYPGISSSNQAKKAIGLAAKYNGVAGGFSALTITALGLSSLGPQAIITVPTVASAIMADIGFSTNTQLRTAYDLSVIHGAPLAMDDVEDCYVVFLTALGVKLSELLGGFGKAAGPYIVTYNVRKMLRSGLRKALQEAFKKIGGTGLARKLTERAMLRLIVPGINVPIAYGLNYFFTKQILTVANQIMRRRGKIVQPLIRLFSLEKDLPKTFAIKILIAVCDAGDPDGWGEEQMNALRYCQMALSLSDKDLSELDFYFDRNIEQVVQEIPKLNSQAATSLLELVITVAALFPDNRYDDCYAKSIRKLGGLIDIPVSEQELKEKLAKIRAELL